jgi:hypothetical protein
MSEVKKAKEKQLEPQEAEVAEESVASEATAQKEDILPKAPPPPNASAPWLGAGSSSWADASFSAPGTPGTKSGGNS